MAFEDHVPEARHIEYDIASMMTLVEAVRKIAVASAIRKPHLEDDREIMIFDTSPEMWPAGPV